MKLWTTNRKTSCLAAHYYKKKKKDVVKRDRFNFQEHVWHWHYYFAAIVNVYPQKKFKNSLADLYDCIVQQ